MRNLTLRQIRFFICAAKHMSFSRAAEELHVSAPAVSQQIKEMEDEMGVLLFHRENRKIAITSAGEYFLTYARRMESTLQEAAGMLKKLQGVDLRPVKIGLVSTAQYFIPLLLLQFKQKYPQAKILIEVCNREQLIDLLREGEIDFAIMGRPPQQVETQAQSFAEHPHVFIASPKHPLAYKKNIQPKALNQSEFISREKGSGTRNIMEIFLADHELSPIVSMEMSSNESIKQAVMADLGISFMSLHTIGSEIKHGQLVVLDVLGAPIVRKWYIVELNKKTHTTAAENFHHFIFDQGSTILKNQFSE